MAPDFYCEEALSGHTPIEVVRETGLVLAFKHTRPHWPTHVVVIPKQHIASLIDLGDGGEPLLAAVMEVVRELAAEITARHGGCHVVTNVGVYQESRHLHFHLGAGAPGQPNR